MATTAAYYPLYTYLPGRFVEGWPAAQPGPALVLAIVAALLLVATGAAAACLSGTDSRWGAAGAGAAAGFIAAIVAEIWVGGAAAGVLGNRAILAHGLRFTSDDNEFRILIADGVIATLWWTYASVWITVAVGLGLGAIGGILAGPGGPPPTPQPMAWLTISIAGLIASTMNIVVAVVIFRVLGQAIQLSADSASHVLPYPSRAASWWPIATGFATLYLWQVVWWRALRQITVTTETERSGVLSIANTGGGIPFALVLLLNLAAPKEVFTLPLSICLLIALALGALALWQAWSLRSTPELSVAFHLGTTGDFAMIGALTSAIVAATSYLIVVATALNLSLLVLPTVVVLATHDAAAAQVALAQSQPLTVLVNNTYSLPHAMVVPGAAFTALMVALSVAVGNLVNRLAARRMATARKDE
nr:hypothetical protein [Chloroflexota bacterium]